MSQLNNRLILFRGCPQVEDWHFCYVEASSALKDRISMLRNAAELVENNLKLLGATGIEDKLQVISGIHVVLFICILTEDMYFTRLLTVPRPFSNWKTHLIFTAG